MENLADKNDAYAKSLLTTRVAQGRMNKAFEDTVVLFSEGGFDRGMASFFNALTDSMERAKPLTEALGAAFEILIKPVNALIRLIGHLGENWGKIADKLGMTKNQLATLTAAIGIFMLPFGGFIVALGAAALALDDFLTYMAGGDSVFGDFVKETPGAQEAIDNIKKSFEGIVGMLGQLLDKLGPVGEAFKGLTLNDVFLAALQQVDNQLQNILKTMQMIQAIFNGDLGAADDAASGINLLGGKTTYQRAKEYFGWGQGGGSSEGGSSGGSWFSGLGDSMSGLGDWLTGPASQRQSIAQKLMGSNDMPTTYSGTVDRGNTTSEPAKIDMGGFTLQLNMEGISNPKEFAEKLQPELQPMFEASLRNALGAARAQQAERQ
jgi:hypothetical protein